MTGVPLFPRGSAWLPSVGLTVRALSSLVCGAFGPAGSDALVRTSAGQLLATNSGETLCQHLKADHPVARFVLDSLATHGRVAGDGSSSVLLLLDGAVREALAHTQTRLGITPGVEASPGAGSPMVAAQARMRRHRLLRALQAIQRHWLADGGLERWLVSEKASAIPCSSANHALGSTDEPARLAVAHVVRTMLGQKLSPAAVGALGTRVVELVFQSRASRTQPLHAVCSALLADFSFVRCGGGGLSFSESVALHGLVFPGRVAVSTMRAQLQNPRTLILHGDLTPAPRKHDAAGGRLHLQATPAQALDFLSSGATAGAAWVARFRAEGIQLLLCTGAVHEDTLARFVAAGISVVHGMDEFDTRRLAKYARSSPVSSLEPFFGAPDALHPPPPLPVVVLGAFTQIVVAGQVLLQVEMHPPEGGDSRSKEHAELIDGHTLLLCGASDAMCRQYESMLQRCLRLIADWSTSSASFAAATSTSIAATPASAHAALTSTHNSLYVVGGGGSVELSLLLFCDAEARRPRFGVSPSRPHLLLPPEALADGAQEQADAFAAAFRTLSCAFAHLLQTLLQNAVPRGHTDSTTQRVDRNTIVPWIKILPHLRAIHEHSGFRNLGFGFVNVLGPPPYAPLHQSLRVSRSQRTPPELLAAQLAVGSAEVSLLGLLPPVFTLGDTLTSATPLFEAASTKVHVVSSMLALLLATLRTEGVLHVPSLAAAGTRGASSSMSSLNVRAGADRRRVRTHDPWNEDAEEERQSDRDSDDSQASEADDD